MRWPTMLRRFRVYVVATMCVVTMLVGCQQSSESDGIEHIVLWHAYRGAEKAALELAIRNYNERISGSGTRVDTLAVPFGAYSAKLNAAIPNGQGPDVFILSQGHLGGFVEAGTMVESIDFYVDDGLRDRFLPRMLEMMTYGDTIYGLPLNFKCLALIYNTDKIDRAPATEAEMIALAQQFTDAEINEYGLAYDYTSFFYHTTLMEGVGGNVFDQSGGLELNSAENNVAMELLLKWKNDDRILPPDPSSALVATLFNSGKTPMVFSGPWFLGEIQPSINYSVATLPQLHGDGRRLTPWLDGDGVYVSSSSSRVRQSFEVAEYLTGLEAARILMTVGKQLPANSAIYEESIALDNPVVMAFLKQRELSVLAPNRAEMALVWGPMDLAIKKIVKGIASPTVALLEAQVVAAESISRWKGSDGR